MYNLDEKYLLFCRALLIGFFALDAQKFRYINETLFISEV